MKEKNNRGTVVINCYDVPIVLVFILLYFESITAMYSFEPFLNLPCGLARFLLNRPLVFTRR